MRQRAFLLSVPPRWRLSLAFGLVLAATLHASWSTLDRYFIGDDFGYVGRFYHLTFQEWPALFWHDWSGGMWGYNLPELRPFAALSFLIDAHCWGANPIGYHVTNLVLDTGCAWLVALIVWRLHAAALWMGCAAGILFAWHPAHAEPVAWITGRVDLLGTLAYLAGFFAGGCYLRSGGRRRWLVLAWLAYGIGCFSKEFCLTLPIALLLWAVIYRRLTTREQFGRLAILWAGFIAVAAVFLVCRRMAFGPSSGSVSALAFLGPEYAERQVDYLRWFLPPLYDFGRDYRSQLVSIAPALMRGSLLIGIAVLALWRWKGPASNRWRAVTFYGFGWYLIATLPLVAASYFAPRHLYLATAGLSITVSLLLPTLPSQRWLAWGVMAVAALFSVSRFDHAVAPWRHAEKLSERVTQEIIRAVPELRVGEVLLVDVADVSEGVWMWSWSTPFALKPPFMPPISQPVLTRPATYYAPQFWAQQPALAALARAPGAVLIRADDKSVVTSRHLDRDQLLAPATQLNRAAPSDSNVAWRDFIAHFSGP